MTPKAINKLLEIISIIFWRNFILKSFPKTIASRLLQTIPKIEPIIKENLYSGYWIPRPIEKRKVLSPNSPISIQKAMINTKFIFKLHNLEIRPVLWFSILSKDGFFIEINPNIPNKIKEI